MLKKRMIILGLAGVLATGFGVAGCSGSSNVVDGTETAKVEESIDAAVANSATEIQEPTEATITTSEETVSRDGKYTHEIGDGSVTLAIETNVHDYMEARGQYTRFAAERLAEDLGWTNPWVELDVGPEKEQETQDFYAYNDAGKVTIEMATWGRTSEKGAIGKNILDVIAIDTPDNSGLRILQNKPEDALYLHNNNSKSITMDQIVILTYLLENKDHLTNGGVLEEVFAPFRDESFFQSVVYRIP